MKISRKQLKRLIMEVLQEQGSQGEYLSMRSAINDMEAGDWSRVVSILNQKNSLAAEKLFLNKDLSKKSLNRFVNFYGKDRIAKHSDESGSFGDILDDIKSIMGYDSGGPKPNAEEKIKSLIIKIQKDPDDFVESIFAEMFNDGILQPGEESVTALRDAILEVNPDAFTSVN